MGLPAAHGVAAANPSAPRWLAASADGWVLAVLVQPGASRSEVAGEHDGRLRIRLAAPAIEGRANAALVALLAKRLGLPRASVDIARGDASRRKQVVLRTALPADAVVAALAAQRDSGGGTSAPA